MTPKRFTLDHGHNGIETSVHEQRDGLTFIQQQGNLTDTVFLTWEQLRFIQRLRIPAGAIMKRSGLTYVGSLIRNTAYKQVDFLVALRALERLTGRKLSETADYSEVEEDKINAGVYDAE